MINKDENNTYRWIYEQPMLKSFFLLYEVWRVLLLAAVIICLLMAIFNLFSGEGFKGVLSAFETAGLVCLIMVILSIPAYYIVTRANNNKYTVLFEMDENGIDHTQIKTDAAKALDALTVFTGMAARQRTTTAAGLLSASGSSLHSDFSKVKKIRCIRENNTILLSSTFIRNQVYAEDEDFDFVSGFIIDHCPNVRTVD